MGNALAARRSNRKTIKIMRLDGHITKLKPPATVGDILKVHPNHVLLHSEAVKHLGIRARPLDQFAELKPKHLYLLVHAHLLKPKPTNSASSAAARLESLLLQRRCVSDIAGTASLPLQNQPSRLLSLPSSPVREGEQTGPIRVKMRLTKAELAELMGLAKTQPQVDDDNEDGEGVDSPCLSSEHSENLLQAWKPALRSIPESCKFSSSKGNRVRFHLHGGEKEQEIQEVC